MIRREPAGVDMVILCKRARLLTEVQHDTGASSKKKKHLCSGSVSK